MSGGLGDAFVELVDLWPPLRVVEVFVGDPPQRVPGLDGDRLCLGLEGCGGGGVGPRRLRRRGDGVRRGFGGVGLGGACLEWCGDERGRGGDHEGSGEALGKGRGGHAGGFHAAEQRDELDEDEGGEPCPQHPGGGPDEEQEEAARVGSQEHPGEAVPAGQEAG